MKHSDGCIICGKPRPSNIAIASYCTSCRAVVAKIRADVAKAMASQNIEPPSGACADCDKPAVCYDHRYYSLPLEVDAVCMACNTNRGPALDVVELGRAMLGLSGPQPAPEVGLQERLDQAERRAIQAALKANGHNMAATAKALGLKYRSIRYRMDKLGID